MLIQLKDPVVRLFFAGSLVYIPFLFVKTLYWDDWAWLWVWWVESPHVLFERTLEWGHPGYWPPIALFYGVGGEYAGVLARTLAVVAHIANCVLLYLILRRPPLTRQISGTTAAIYLFSPFYYARGGLMQSFYDLFMLCYLLSIWLLRFRSKGTHLAAMGSFVASLSLETLMSLEPLRVLFVHQRSKGVRGAIRRCVPFWILAAGFVVVRFAWLQPHGIYEGYNAVNLSALALVQNLVQHGIYYVHATMFTLQLAVELVSWGGIVVLAIVVMLAGTSGLLEGRYGPAREFRRESPRAVVWCFFFGEVLALLGAVAYAVAGRVPGTYSFGSRLAYVSIPGISVAGAALISAIRPRQLRSCVLVLLLTILTLSSLQLAKWYLFDSLIQRDLVMQLMERTSRYPGNPPMFLVRMVPPSREVLVLNRKMAAEDLNVPVNLLRGSTSSPTFIYDEEWWSDPTNRPGNQCTVTTIDRYPCPPRVVRLEYRLDVEYASVTRVSYWDVLRSVIGSWEPGCLGALEGDDGMAEKQGSGASGFTWGQSAEAGRVVRGILRLGLSCDRDRVL